MKQLKNLLKKLTKFKVNEKIVDLYKDALKRDIFGANPEKKSVYISKTKKPSNPRLVKTGALKKSYTSVIKPKSADIGFTDKKVKVQALIKKYNSNYFKLSREDKTKISKEITKLTQKLIDDVN